MNQRLRDPIAWGIPPEYIDHKGDRAVVSREVVGRILDAMEAEQATPPPALTKVVTEGEELGFDHDVTVLLEDGTEVVVRAGAPTRLPLGYHSWSESGAEAAPLIVGPARCFLPDDLNAWGFAAQLYSVRSESSWGIGDLGDLKTLGAWATTLGAGVVMVNPLHAVTPGAPQQASPYFPSSRCFRNPLYLRIEDIPGAQRIDLDLGTARALNATDIIDRDSVYELKMSTLERAFESFMGDDRFERYKATHGRALEDFATYNALYETYGKGPSSWPLEHRDPNSETVGQWRQASHTRIEFHMWIQWLIEEQLARSEATTDVIHDLAVGVDPEGADAWIWKDVFADGVTIGAPPDEFNARGQDWSLPPMDPWKMQAAGYEPFIRTVRAGLSSGSGLRVDHVMGLFRLFWIPDGCAPTEGAYVRYPYEDLLTILALESVRAQSFVIGEDLGTVEDFVRDQMAERALLSNKIMWFEDDPSEFPELSLAAVTNHDLATIPGIWSRRDLAELEDLDLAANVEGDARLRARLREWTGLPEDAPVDEVVERAYGVLARASSRIKLATLEDALGVELRPNVPGTLDERPNWARPLPCSLEEAMQHPGPRAVANSLTTPGGQIP